MRYWDITNHLGIIPAALGAQYDLGRFLGCQDLSIFLEKRGWEILELTGDFQWENHRTVGGVSSKPCD